MEYSFDNVFFISKFCAFVHGVNYLRVKKEFTKALLTFSNES